MSVKIFLLPVGAILVVYIVFLVREIAQASRGGYAVGLPVLIFVLLRPLFWLIAVPIFGIVFWATFKRGPG